jgi:hypothetical protein
MALHTLGAFRYPSEITENEPFAPLHSTHFMRTIRSALARGDQGRPVEEAARSALRLEALRRLEGATG